MKVNWDPEQKEFVDAELVNASFREIEIKYVGYGKLSEKLYDQPKEPLTRGPLVSGFSNTLSSTKLRFGEGPLKWGLSRSSESL